jgi:hypothetical protein
MVGARAGLMPWKGDVGDGWEWGKRMFPLALDRMLTDSLASCSARRWRVASTHSGARSASMMNLRRSAGQRFRCIKTDLCRARRLLSSASGNIRYPPQPHPSPTSPFQGISPARPPTMTRDTAMLASESVTSKKRTVPARCPLSSVRGNNPVSPYPHPSPASPFQGVSPARPPTITRDERVQKTMNQRR